RPGPVRTCSSKEGLNTAPRGRTVPARPGQSPHRWGVRGRPCRDWATRAAAPPPTTVPSPAGGKSWRTKRWRQVCNLPVRGKLQTCHHHSDRSLLARGGIFMTMPVSNSVASHSVDRATFEDFYAGPAPWDIGKPQGTFVAIADRVTGPVLDAGCGTGEHALFFAA